MSGITGATYTSKQVCSFRQFDNKPVTWKGRLPIQLNINSTESKEFKHSLDMAIKVWHDAAGQTLFIIKEDGSNKLGYKFDGRNSITLTKDWPHAKDMQAVTTLFSAGAALVEADMIINLNNFNYVYEDDFSFTKVDMVSLLIHELGHVLGMMHEEHTEQSVMFPRLEFGQARRELSNLDKANLKCGYSL